MSDISEIDRKYCKANLHNLEILKAKYNFWELGVLSNYLQHYNFIIIYIHPDKSKEIECRFIKENNITEYPSFKFISDEDLETLLK